MQLCAVVGMHRSGTSLVSRGVNLLGFSLGDRNDLITAGSDNARGFWESRRIVSFHDSLLATLGGSWDAPPALKAGWQQEPGLPEAEAFEALLQDVFSYAPLRAWKDPRGSLLLPLWKPWLAHSVVVVRHPGEVAASLDRRNGIDSEWAHYLWARYTAHAVAAVANPIVVVYEEVLRNPGDWFESIGEQLGVDGTARTGVDAFLDHVDASQRHEKAPRAAPVDALHTLAADMYSSLREPLNDDIVSVCRDIAGGAWRESSDTRVRELANIHEQLARVRVAVPPTIPARVRWRELLTKLEALERERDEQTARLSTKLEAVERERDEQTASLSTKLEAVERERDEQTASLATKLEAVERERDEQAAAAQKSREELMNRLRHQERRRVAELERAQRQRREAERELRTIRRSTSWRITQPVRALGTVKKTLATVQPRDIRMAVALLIKGEFGTLRTAARGRLTPRPATDHTETADVAEPRAALDVVRSLRAAGDLAGADAAAADAIGAAARPDVALLREAAEVSMVRRQWDVAVDRWQTLLAVSDLQFPQAVRGRLALAARMAGDLSLAEFTCRAGLAESPNDLQLLREHAETAMDRADWQVSIERWLAYQNAGGRAAVADAGTIACRRLLDDGALRQEIADYQAAHAELRRNPAVPRIVVATAIVGGYDPLHLPPRLDPSVEYVVFTDRHLDGLGVFDVHPLAYHDTDTTRAARYVKTHLHQLIGDADVAIWVDSNVLSLGSYGKLAQSVLDSGLALGAIPHPRRFTVFEESDACLSRGKDDSQEIVRQVDRYRKEGLGEHRLIESNLLVFDLRDDRLHGLLSDWWAEIERGSRRDQLALPYVIARHQQPWHELMDHPTSLRDHPEFLLLDHGTWGAAATATAARLAPSNGRRQPAATFAEVKENRLAAVADISVDVIVCVHNAPEEVGRCLAAIEATRRSDVHRLIVIDDGSEPETAQLLRHHVGRASNARLLRNEKATGYTRAANLGLEESMADVAILLNSDTVPTNDWIDKLVDALHTTPGAGIAGPLSNAASHQSIPDHQSSSTQTAINELPPGMDVEAMNVLCERWSPPTFPRVPLVHGFCLAIARPVRETIGTFDEASFPHGYGEENDFCFRATDAGFALVIATNTFVFHEKSRSYDPARRVPLMKRGSQTLRELHGRRRIARAIVAMQTHPALLRARRRAWGLWATPLPSSGPVRVDAYVQAPQGYPTSSAFIRLQQPTSHPSVAPALSVAIHDGNARTAGDDMGQVAILQRSALPSREIADLLLERIRTTRGRLVVDIDDALSLLAAASTNADGQYQRNHALDYAVAQADAIWCSTPAIADLYSHLNDNQRILLNTIDPRLWGELQDLPPWQPPHVLRLLFAGTYTHRGGLDLVLPALDQLAQSRPGRFNVTIIGVAKTLPARPWLRRLAVPSGHNRYPEYVGWLRNTGPFDVGIAPLRVHPFDVAKSDLKFLDYTALGLVTVASTVGPFVEHAEAGRLIAAGEGTTGWFDALLSLVDRPAMARPYIERARDYVGTERSVETAASALLHAVRALDDDA